MTSPDHRPVLVVADDEPLALALIVDLLEPEGYEVLTARDGEEAWTHLENPAFPADLLITDRLMPRLDGMALLERVQRTAHLDGLNTIFVTSLDSEQDIIDGIAAGVYYYLTKPYQPQILRAVVAAALSDIHAQQRRTAERPEQRTPQLAGLVSGRFVCRTSREARDLARTLAGASRQPETAALGLTELLLNAVEHGNLGIGYKDKGKMLLDGSFDTEIERRLALPEFAGRQVVIDVERLPDGTRYLIRDEGAGFDPARFLTIDPARATDWHGRGIALARMTSFDSVEYRGRGNEVVAVVRDTPPLP
jgi:DNA-binding response OmpR family regulator